MKSEHDNDNLDDINYTALHEHERGNGNGSKIVSTPDYFDKRDPEEDSIIQLDKQTSLRYKKIENIYNTLVPLDYYEAAKKKSLSEQVRLRVKTEKNKTFTYGEMTFRTMAYVFEVIKQTFGEDSIKIGDFYDLGSGHGNVCAQVALIHPFENIYGIEILSPLHKMAVKTKARYDENILRIITENSELFPRHKADSVPNLNFVKGSFFDVDWTKASVVYSNSTLFSDQIYKYIFDKVQELPSGSFHINICDYMPDELMKDWECVNPFSRLMSWGTSEILIYRKK